jgi:hypothetical protein
VPFAKLNKSSKDKWGERLFKHPGLKEFLGFEIPYVAGSKPFAARSTFSNFWMLAVEEVSKPVRFGTSQWVWPNRESIPMSDIIW